MSSWALSLKIMNFDVVPAIWQSIFRIAVYLILNVLEICSLHSCGLPKDPKNRVPGSIRADIDA
jgi:hypothetical protein